jgi:hypothetical protein
MAEQRTNTGRELGKALVIATGVATLLTVFFPLHGFMERQKEQQAQINELQKQVSTLQLESAVLQTKVQAIQSWPPLDSK